uniref:PAS domain-containing protein n=1 Tax=Schistocephalus solidus TaxID=70667 RepID=A0A183TDH3_SCHSO
LANLSSEPTSPPLSTVDGNSPSSSSSSANDATGKEICGASDFSSSSSTSPSLFSMGSSIGCGVVSGPSVARVSRKRTQPPPPPPPSVATGSPSAVISSTCLSETQTKLKKPAGVINQPVSASCRADGFLPMAGFTADSAPSRQTGLSPREVRALRRKEKSRLAAKVRRNRESNILSQLMHALPVPLDAPSASATSRLRGEDAATVPCMGSCVSLEKSGVIRIAGQTLFLYNSLSQILGTQSTPLISLLSRSIYGLFVHPRNRTIAYVTPPLAEALGWPWINLIGEHVSEILEDTDSASSAPSSPLSPSLYPKKPQSNSPGRPLMTAGQTVRLRILQPSSPTKPTVHLFHHNHSRPLHPNSCLDATAPSAMVWSSQLYRNKSSQWQSTPSPASDTSKSKSCTSLVCSCFAAAQVPISQAPSPSQPVSCWSAMETFSATAPDNHEDETNTVRHLDLYFLQPLFIPSPYNVLQRSLGDSAPSVVSQLATDGSPRRSLNRLLAERHQRRDGGVLPGGIHAVDNSPVLLSDGTPRRDQFFTYLDHNIHIKNIEISSLLDVSNLIGHSFLDLIHLGDLPSITKLLNKCESVSPNRALDQIPYAIEPSAFHSHAQTPTLQAKVIQPRIKLEPQQQQPREKQPLLQAKRPIRLLKVSRNSEFGQAALASGRSYSLSTSGMNLIQSKGLRHLILSTSPLCLNMAAGFKETDVRHVTYRKPTVLPPIFCTLPGRKLPSPPSPRRLSPPDPRSSFCKHQNIAEPNQLEMTPALAPSSLLPSPIAGTFFDFDTIDAVQQQEEELQELDVDILDAMLGDTATNPLGDPPIAEFPLPTDPGLGNLVLSTPHQIGAEYRAPPVSPNASRTSDVSSLSPSLSTPQLFPSSSSLSDLGTELDSDLMSDSEELWDLLFSAYAVSCDPSEGEVADSPTTRRPEMTVSTLWCPGFIM